MKWGKKQLAQIDNLNNVIVVCIWELYLCCFYPHLCYSSFISWPVRLFHIFIDIIYVGRYQLLLILNTYNLFPMVLSRPPIIKVTKYVTAMFSFLLLNRIKCSKFWVLHWNLIYLVLMGPEQFQTDRNPIKPCIIIDVQKIKEPSYLSNIGWCVDHLQHVVSLYHW